jgi:peptide/nickel transport system substrate-binding protein
MSVTRRDVVKGVAAAGMFPALGGLARPALAQKASVLKFVPQANLANFDPIWGTQYVVRNAAALVWDTLYGVDSTLTPKRQMVESEDVSSDGFLVRLAEQARDRYRDRQMVRRQDGR